MRPQAQTAAGTQSQTQAPPALHIMSLKAFGDFVIACHALRSVRNGIEPESVSLVAGEHLRELAHALGVASGIRFLRSGPTVPPLFDLKRCGVIGGARSWTQLKKQLSDLPAGTTLLFDRVGWRESIIAFGRRTKSLPVSANIYRAYRAALHAAGFMLHSDTSPREARDHDGIARIYPGSRIPRKVLPRETIAALVQALQRLGQRAEVVCLEKERVDIPPGVPVRVVPRDFSSLTSSVASARLVLSADSLPAHLAEYMNVPVFVAMPAPNSYWLPETAFEGHAWAEFSHLLDTNEQLSRFLNEIRR